MLLDVCGSNDLFDNSLNNVNLAIYLPRLYKILDYFGMETGAFSQLTREYMQQEFNPATPNVPGVRYADRVRSYVLC